MCLGFFWRKEEQKPLPLIQRGIISESQAIVYQYPDFDAPQITIISKNKIIVMSTEIYRPKNLFGSFYKIFINKPKKMKGYISEVDVIPQYRKDKKRWSLNSVYKEKESNLRQVQKRSAIVNNKPKKRKDVEIKKVQKKEPEFQDDVEF